MVYAPVGVLLDDPGLEPIDTGAIVADTTRKSCQTSRRPVVATAASGLNFD
jgi:hypothetical protein